MRRFGHWRPKSEERVCKPVEASSRISRLKNGVFGENVGRLLPERLSVVRLWQGV